MEHVTHGITLDGVARFVDIATDALSAAREEIDALNVYAVPDGDTGRIMFLTISAARDGLREARAADPDLSLGDGMAVLARAALMGARGNSGVILSQMLRAYVRHLAGAAIADRPAETIAAPLALQTGDVRDARVISTGTPHLLVPATDRAAAITSASSTVLKRVSALRSSATCRPGQGSSLKTPIKPDHNDAATVAI